MASVMRQFFDNSYLFGGNAAFIEDLYEKYLVNPQSVPDQWRDYFDRMQVLPGSSSKDVAHAPIISFSCAIQPTVRASAKFAVKRLTGMPIARCTMPE